LKNPRYSLSEIENAVSVSTSLRQAIKQLGLIPAGGNYQTLKRHITYYEVDTSHFTGKGWLKGKTLPPRRPTQEYLDNTAPIQSYKLRNRLINEGVLPHECARCKNTEWQNSPIALELHHIDGNSKNNNLENLQLLCPNCHALTENYRGKAKKIARHKPRLKKKSKLQEKKLPLIECQLCNQNFIPKEFNQIYCSTPCYHTATKGRPKIASRKVDRPPIHVLLEELNQSSFSALGRKYGVSDNAVRKWLKIEGINPQTKLPNTKK